MNSDVSFWKEAVVRVSIHWCPLVLFFGLNL